MEAISKKKAVRAGKGESNRIFEVYTKIKLMIKHQQ